MNELESLPRRRFFMRVALSAGALVLSGCQKLSESEWFPKVLALGERASAATGTLIVWSEATDFDSNVRAARLSSSGVVLDSPAISVAASTEANTGIYQQFQPSSSS